MACIFSSDHPRQTRTDKQTPWVRFVLLSLDPGIRIPHWEGGMPSLRMTPHQERVELSTNETAMGLSYHLQVAFFFFFLFSTCFVPIIHWLFPRVLKTDAVKFSPNILVLCTRLSPGKFPLLFSLGVTGFSDLSLQSRD